MKKKYCAKRYGNDHITKVNVLRETPKFVWLEEKNGGERRQKTESEYCAYFNTFYEAKGWLISKRRQALDLAQHNLDVAKLRLEAAENIKDKQE